MEPLSVTIIAGPPTQPDINQTFKFKSETNSTRTYWTIIVGSIFLCLVGLKNILRESGTCLEGILDNFRRVFGGFSIKFNSFQFNNNFFSKRQVRTGQVRTSQLGTGQVRTGQVWTSQVGIYQVGTGQVRTDKVLHLRNVKSRYLV